jgi:hypothetical protein
MVEPKISITVKGSFSWLVILLVIFMIFRPSQLFAINIVQKDVRYGNRFYIARQLAAIYGPDAQSIIEKSVIHGVTAFGGACDPYRTIKTQGTNKRWTITEGKEDECPTGMNEAKVGIFNDSGVIRALALDRVCVELSRCQACLRFIENTIWISDKINPEQSKFAKALVGRFYTFDPPKILIDEIERTKLGLNRAAQMLCQSGLWQIP